MTNKSIRDYINLIENAQREGVAEGSSGLVAYIKNYEHELEKYKQKNANGKYDAKIKDLEKIIANLKSKQGVAEEQLEETTPDAMSKIDELFRDK